MRGATHGYLAHTATVPSVNGAGYTECCGSLNRNAQASTHPAKARGRVREREREADGQNSTKKKKRMRQYFFSVFFLSFFFFTARCDFRGGDVETTSSARTVCMRIVARRPALPPCGALDSLLSTLESRPIRPAPALVRLNFCADLRTANG